MRKNPFDAIDPAMSHTKKALFGPWSFERWITLGMLCFLQTCAGIGMGDCSGGNFNLPVEAFEKFGSKSDDSSAHMARPPHTALYAELAQPVEAPDDAVADDAAPEPTPEETAEPHEFSNADFDKALGFMRANAALIWTLGGILLVLVIGLTVLFQWLGARAVFAYIDNLATFRAEVERPWREQAPLADSYFRWRLGIIGVQLVGLALVGIPTGVLAYRTVVNGGSDGWLALVTSAPFWVGVAGVILVGLVSLIIIIGMYDVVAPVQYCRRCTTGDAIALSLTLVAENFGAFLLYLVLKLLVSIAFAIIIVAVGLLTCCCGFLVMIIPVLGQALLQPLWVFHRMLSVYFVGGLDARYDVITRASSVATPTPAP